MLACPLEDRVLLHLKVGFPLPSLTNGQTPSQNACGRDVLVDATISLILATMLASLSVAAGKRTREELTLPCRHLHRRRYPAPCRYVGLLWLRFVPASRFSWSVSGRRSYG